MAFRLFSSARGMPLARPRAFPIRIAYTTQSKPILFTAENERNVARTRVVKPPFHGMRHFSSGGPENADFASKIEGGDSQRLTVEVLPGRSLWFSSESIITSPVPIEELSVGKDKKWLFVTCSNRGKVPASISLEHLYAPSKIMRLNMNEYGNELVCVWPGFLCGSGSLDIKYHGIGSILGDFVTGKDKRYEMPKLTGDGEVFLSGPGLSKVEIRKGAQLKVPLHRVVAFAAGMDCSKFAPLELFCVRL